MGIMKSEEVMPTASDREHIGPLAQAICDLVQDYAVAHEMTLPGVMSAIGTASGAMLARAYHDKQTAIAVSDRLAVAAAAAVEMMHANDPLILRRKSGAQS